MNIFWKLETGSILNPKACRTGFGTRWKAKVSRGLLGLGGACLPSPALVGMEVMAQPWKQRGAPVLSSWRAGRPCPLVAASLGFLSPW